MRKTVTLLIEDSFADQKMTIRSLEESKIVTDLRIVDDGEEALQYLYREEKYADEELSPRPDIILLDLNLPKVDGRDILKKLKADDNLKSIPVIVLTTSEAEKDVLESYDLGINSYIIKPINFYQFHKCIQELSNYWFNLVTLPSK